MRKTMKKIVSVLVSCLMVMMLFANAFAADDFTITITAPDDDKATHTYAAYQIFTGDLYEDPATGEKSLINLAFGEGVDAAALKEALGLDASATAQDCADELLEITPEEAADILIGHVEGRLPMDRAEKRIVRTRLIIRGTTR